MRCCRMLLSAVRDTAGELARCKGPEPATCPGPAQTQPQGARQAELVICDKAIERTLAWLNRFRRLTVRYERRADIHLAFTILGCALICLNQIRRFC
jgi:transposase